MANYWFIARSYNRYSKLALYTFILAFIVILLGAYTRLTDAGLSCPDWPNCYGYVTAPHTEAQIETATKIFPANPVNVKKAWTEMTHRYFAGFEGLLILLLAFSLWNKRRSLPINASYFASILTCLLLIQVLLGMLTVTEKLKPIIVLGHLLTGISILSVLWWTYLSTSTKGLYLPRRIISFLWLGMFIMFLQVTLGGWVSTHYAGLACIDLPYCNGKLIPEIQWNNLNSDLIGIHMLHRFGAILTATYMCFLTILLYSYRQTRALAFMLFALLLLQLTLGVLNILWLRPVWIALAHHAIGITLFITLLTPLARSMDKYYV